MHRSRSDPMVKRLVHQKKTTGLAQWVKIGVVLCYQWYATDIRSWTHNFYQRPGKCTKIFYIKILPTKSSWAIRSSSHPTERSWNKHLDQLVQWSEKWQISFNVDKCKVIHLEPKNCIHCYNMQRKPLKFINGESHLAMTWSQGSIVIPQERKTNTMVRFIVSNFEHKTRRSRYPCATSW